MSSTAIEYALDWDWRKFSDLKQQIKMFPDMNVTVNVGVVIDAKVGFTRALSKIGLHNCLASSKLPKPKVWKLRFFCLEVLRHGH